MINLIYRIKLFSQIDAGVYALEKQIELYRLVLMAMILAVIILIVLCLLQRIYYTRRLVPAAAPALARHGKKKARSLRAGVDPAELPDPGLIFRFALPDDGGDRIITIGRNEGSIRTWSTEIINDHLELHVIYYVNLKEQKLYELPDPLYTDYAIELRCRGNVLIHYPGLDGYRRMNSSEKIYITSGDAFEDRISFNTITAAQPLRFRLGSELGEWDRFISGYFEFHLYLQDHEVEREGGMPGVEKYFMLRLYRIYPGYDVSSPDTEGLYPMIDPFSGENRYE